MANENIWKQIEEVNKKIKTIDLKGKSYAQAKDRVIAFRKIYPKGRITTNYVESENYVIFEAIVCDENGCILATGHARTLRNKEKCYEKCETNAVARAMAYIGIGTAEIESYEGIQEFEEEKIFNDEEMEKDKKRKAEAIEKFNKLSMEAKANILNLFHTKNVETINTDTLVQLVNNAK